MARRFRRLAAGFAFLSNAFLAALVVGAAVPGQQRVLCPECYGLTEIAPRVWTDAPGRAGELLGLIGTAKARVSGFFGDAATTPLFVLCGAAPCAETFGFASNGLSISDLVVLLGPRGLNEGTLTHEMTHSRLHRRKGLGTILRQPYPTWFDEGLATFVSGSPRWQGTVTGADRARVRQTEHFWQWGRTLREMGVGRAYAAAAAEVARIEDRAGRAGLLELIARAEAGEDLGALEAELAK